MNEEALKDSYNLFVETGYKGSIEDYTKLINTNSDALMDAHKLFTDTGYNGDLDSFSSLLGVKKKDPSQESLEESQESFQQPTQPGDQQIDQEETLDLSAPELSEEDKAIYEAAGGLPYEEEAQTDAEQVDITQMSPAELSVHMEKQRRADVAENALYEANLQKGMSNIEAEIQTNIQKDRMAEEERRLEAEGDVEKYTELYQNRLNAAAGGAEGRKDLIDYREGQVYRNFLTSDADVEEADILTSIKQLQDRIESVRTQKGVQQGDRFIPFTDEYKANTIKGYEEELKKLNDKLTTNRKDRENKINYQISDLSIELNQADSDEEREEIQRKIDILNSHKEVIFKPIKQVTKEITDGESIEKLPGETAQEKFNNYYDALYQEFDDLSNTEVIKEMMGDRGLFFQAKSFLAEGGLGLLFTDPKKQEVTERWFTLQQKLENYAPVRLLNRYEAEAEEGGFTGFGKGFLTSFGNWMAPINRQTDLEKSQEIYTTLKQTGVDVEKGIEEAARIETDDKGDVSYGSYGLSDPEFYGNLLGTSSAIMSQMLLPGAVAKGTKLVKYLDKAEDFSKVISRRRYLEELTKSPRLAKLFNNVTTKTISFGKKAASSGISYEATGIVFTRAEDEANFMSGLYGSVGEQTMMAMFPQTRKFIPIIHKMLGDNGMQRFITSVTKRGSQLTGRGLGETAEEFMQEISSIQRESNGDFYGELDRRFGTMEEATKFFVGSFIMGAFMGGGSELGNDLWKTGKAGIEKLREINPTQAKRAMDAISYISDGTINALNESVDESKVNGEYKVGGKDVPYSDIEELVDAAESVEDLEGISVKNDEELENKISQKYNELSKKEPTVEKVEETKEATPTEERGEEALEDEAVPVESVSDEEYNKFVDEGTVMDETLNTIAEKIKKGETLSEREQAIHSDKTAEVEEILKAEPVEEIEAEVEEVAKIEKPIISKNSEVEVNRVKNLDQTAEDGQTFNIDGTTYQEGGLVVPITSKNITQEELTPEAVADFIEEHQNKIGDAGVVKAGIYKFPNSNQVSIDLNIVVPSKNRAVALEFGRLSGQESLFDLDTFENVKTGADGKTPMSFDDNQFKEIARALKGNQMPNVFKESTIEEVVKTEPTEGSTVTLPPRIKGGTERIFQFDKGVWKQKVGGELTTISENLQEELTNKFKEDAVQKQTTGEIPVQPKAESGKKVAERKPEAKPEKAAKEEVKSKPDESVRVKPKNKEESRKQRKQERIEKRKATPPKSFKRQNVSDIDEIIAETTDVEQRKALETVKNITKALSKIAPDAVVVIHENQESYTNAVLEAGGTKENAQTRGMLDVGNKIHINLSKAKSNTVLHEASHIVMASYLKKNPQAVSKFKKELESILSEEDKAILDDFVKSYKGDSKAVQDEEYVIEALAMIAEEQIVIPERKQNAFINLIKRLAKAVGLNPDLIKLTGNEDIIEFAGKLKESFSEGRAIKLDPSRIKNSVKKFQADYSDVVSGVTFVYDKNSEKFKKLERSGYITRDKVLSDFDGDYILLHQPDGAFSGEIFKKGQKLIEGKGGMYYPIKFHNEGFFWASTARVANKMAADLNEAAKKNGGRLLMALTTAPKNKLLSSTTAANGVMDLFLSKAFDDKFRITKKDVFRSIVAAAKKTATVDGKKVGLGIKDINLDMDIDQVLSKIRESLGPENSNFKSRKFFVEELANNIANNISTKAGIKDLVDFFGEGIGFEAYKGKSTGKISKANLLKGLSEMLTEPILKSEGEKGGRVYAIIELEGKPGEDVVEAVDSDKHESYPKAIKSKVGNKVKLHILKDRNQWSDYFMDPETGKPVAKNREKKVYPTTGVSTSALKLNTSQEYEIIELKDEGKSITEVSPKPRFQKASIGDNLIEKAGKTSGIDFNDHLTRDNQGNYLFYHYSPASKKFIGDKIQPTLKKNAHTSDKRSIPVSYYYTTPNFKESVIGFTEDAKIVRIAPDKVYPLNSDPLGYYDQAKENFKNKFGEDMAFEPSRQADFINELAKADGFEMLVAHWEYKGRTLARAESQIPHSFEAKVDPVLPKNPSGERKVADEDVKVKKDESSVLKEEILSWSNDKYKGKFNPFMTYMTQWGLKGFYENYSEYIDDLPSNLKERVNSLAESGEMKFQRADNIDEAKDYINDLKEDGFLNDITAKEIFEDLEEMGIPLDMDTVKSLREESLKSEKQVKEEIWDNDAIKSGKTKKVEQVTDVNISEINKVYDEVSRESIIEEAKRIVRDNPIEAVERAVLDGKNGMDEALRAVLMLELIKHYEANRNDAAAEKLWNIYTEAGTKTAQALAIRAVASQDPEIRTRSIIREARQGNDSFNKSTGANGKTNRENIDDSFNELQEIAKEVGIEVANTDSINSIIEKIVSKKLQGTTSEKIAVSKAKIKKARATRAKLAKEFKDSKDDMFYSTIIPGLTPKAIEYFGRVAKTYIDEGVANAEILVQKIKQFAKENHDADIRDEDIEKIKERFFSIEVEQTIDDYKKEIKNIITDHYSVKEALQKDLSQKLIDRLDLSESDAKKIEKAVKKEFKEKVQQLAAQNLDNVYKKTNLPRNHPAIKNDYKDDVDKLIEAANMGALSDNVYRDLISSRFGYRNLTDSDVEMLEKYLDIIQTLEPGEFRNRKIQALENELSKLEDVSKFEVVGNTILEIFYTSVLSGVSTISRALKGAALTGSFGALTSSIANPMAAPGAFRAMLGGIKRFGFEGWFQVLKDGYADADFFEIKPSAQGTLDQIVNQTFKEHLSNIKEAKGKEKAIESIKALTKVFFHLPTKSYRFLLANDALMKAGLREFNAYIEGYNAELLKSNGKREIGFWNNLNKNLSLDKSSIQQAQIQAQQEVESLKAMGEEIPAGYEKRRTQEIIELKRDQKYEGNTQKALEKANEMLLMNDPVGVLGAMYRGIQKATKTQPGDSKVKILGKMFLRMVGFPFIRVATNYMNTAIDYNPIAAIPRAIKRTYFGVSTRDGSRMLTPREKREMYAKMVIGTSVATLAMMAMFDTDDDDNLVMDEDSWLEITAGGPGQYYIEGKSVSPDYKTYSFRFKNPFTGELSGWYSYLDSPLGSILAPLGSVSDTVRFKNFRKEAQDKETKDMSRLDLINPSHLLKFLTSQSYSQGLKNLQEITGYALASMTGDLTPGQEEYMNKKIVDLVSRPAKGMMMPNLYKQFYQQYSAYTDKPMKYTRGYDKIFKDIPLLENIIEGDEYDIFGYPVVRDFDVPLIPDVLLDAAKKNRLYREDKPEWKVIYDFPEVNVGGYVKTPKDLKHTNITKAEYLETYGKYFRKNFNEGVRKLKKSRKYNAIELQKMIKSTKSKTTTEVKKKLKIKKPK